MAGDMRRMTGDSCLFHLSKEATLPCKADEQSLEAAITENDTSTLFHVPDNVQQLHTLICNDVSSTQRATAVNPHSTVD